MQITVNLMDLLLALLIMAGITLVVSLIIFIIRLLQALKNLSHIVEDLHEPLTQTTDQLPALLRKVDSISTDVSAISKAANETVPAILSDVKTITGTARAGVEAVGSAAESVSSGVSSLFSSGREHSDNFSSIIGIVDQILQIVNLFTHHDKPKYRKPFYGRNKKRRR